MRGNGEALACVLQENTLHKVAGSRLLSAGRFWEKNMSVNRFTSFLLASALGLGAFACGDDSGSKSSNNPTDPMADAGATDEGSETDEGSTDDEGTDPETTDATTDPPEETDGSTDGTDTDPEEPSISVQPEPEPEPDPELPTEPGDGETEFISELSTAGGSTAAVGGIGGANGGAVSAPSTDATGADGAVEAAPTPTPAPADPVMSPTPAPEVDPARAIAEADILQIRDDTLYALSTYNGLTLIDISNPTELNQLGLYRTLATPFEMYLEDEIAIVLFNDSQTYIYDEDLGTYRWQMSSRVQALDTSDPRNIHVLGEFTVPGRITDSRLVGEIMYLVTEQWAGCWRCEPTPNTTVTSFDVSDPSDTTQIDQLQLLSPPDTYTGDRTIAVSEDRIYVSGWEWRTYEAGRQQTGSITVVDISDPAGYLTEGAKIDLGGQVSNRWQMDEYEGVLRVISQPGGWGSTNPPVVETFQINSSLDLAPLGSLTMTLPERENLQSVRFDGERAYAVTVLQTDPLFTFDLSDPASPQQMGDIEIPGSIYHMEPRGDRVYAIGFDQTNEVGALHVSLFDVSDMEAPVMLERVNFGGDWGTFAEDKDRIHKSFRLLSELGLIVVPFSGYEYDELGCQAEHQSGIQLVDYTEDSLDIRGVAASIGRARRAFVHDDSLFSVSDNTVQSFDIENRDEPVDLDVVDIARNISSTRVVNDHLMRFGADWYTNRTILDMTPVEDAGFAQPLAEVNLSELFGENEYNCTSAIRWTGQVFVRGNYAYVPRFEYTYRDEDGAYVYENQLTFYIVDMTDGENPEPIGKFSTEPALSNEYIGSITQTDNALLIGRTRLVQVAMPNPNGSPQPIISTVPQFSYDIIDLRTPEAPVHASTFDVPRLLADYGWGMPIPYCAIDMYWGWWGGYYYPYYYPFYYYGYPRGYGNALVSGDIVASQHYEVVDYAGRVKYYLDRIDVSDPENPQLLEPINIPGSVVHFDADDSEIITLDYVRDVVPTDDFDACYQLSPYAYFDERLGECNVFQRTLNSLTLEDDKARRLSSVLIDDEWRTTAVAVSDERVFLTQQQVPDPEQPTTTALLPKRIKAYRTTADAEFQEIANVPLEEELYYPYGNSGLRARGRRVFDASPGQMMVLDTVDAMSPRVSRHEMPGYACSALEVADDKAYCALGTRGVEIFDLAAE